MSENKGKSSAKNLIFLVVTALILIVATFCWFLEARKNQVDENIANVATASSHAVFYQATDSNKNNVIDGTESYAEVETSSIDTVNMVPGQTYFYMVELEAFRDECGFGLYFEGITDNNTNSVSEETNQKYGDNIFITAKLQNRAGTKTLKILDYTKFSSLYNSDGEIVNAELFTYSGDDAKAGFYRIYYTVKLADNFEIDKAGYNLSIENVKAITMES